MTERELCRLFRELHAADPPAPPLESVWPVRPKRPHRRRLRLAAAAALVAGLLAVTVAILGPLDRGEGPSPALSGLPGELPTDFLARAPGTELLREVPAVGHAWGLAVPDLDATATLDLPAVPDLRRPAGQGGPS